MLGEKNILVVNDEPHVRDLTCRALRHLGIDCKEASDGNEAFVMARKLKFDGVLADLQMPNRSGFELCDGLLEMPSSPNLMVLTGDKDERIAFDLMNRGVKRIFHKPVQYEQLAQDVVATVFGPEAEPVAKKQTESEILQEAEKTLCEITSLYADKLDPLFDNAIGLPFPPEGARHFAAQLARNEGNMPGKRSLYGTDNRRRFKRCAPCFTVATAVEVDREWKALGEPYKLSVRDISEGGMSLLHSRSINSKYLAVSWYATQLATEEIKMPCRVTRCRPYRTFYEIGLQFVYAD